MENASENLPRTYDIYVFFDESSFQIFLNVSRVLKKKKRKKKHEKKIKP
jgi:hypothetical protein